MARHWPPTQFGGDGGFPCPSQKQPSAKGRRSLVSYDHPFWSVPPTRSTPAPSAEVSFTNASDEKFNPSFNAQMSMSTAVRFVTEKAVPGDIVSTLTAATDDDESHTTRRATRRRSMSGE